MARRVNRGSGRRATVTAQHVERRDVDGNLQVKTFTQEVWDTIPPTHYADKGNVTKRSRGGWVEIKEPAEPPKKLKETKAPITTEGEKKTTDVIFADSPETAVV